MQKSNNVSFITLILWTLALSINHTSAQGVQSSYCPWGNTPICGDDYQTYPNICALQAAGVNILNYGVCNFVVGAGGTMVSNCPSTLNLVCGKDGITYGNLCRMEFQNVTFASNGPCNLSPGTVYVPQNSACICDSAVQPVCTLEGTTYESNCVLACTSHVAVSQIACQTQCNCETVYDPVCGVDGRTYDNRCLMRCVNTALQGRGECANIIKSCSNCSPIPLEVCGTDGKTYLNLCYLNCNNVNQAAFGPCSNTTIPVDPNSCASCSQVYVPICGSDGKNYNNSCLCTCQSTCQVYSQGLCPVDDTQNVDPVAACQANPACNYCSSSFGRNYVCASDGNTYQNACFVGCCGQSVISNGPCNTQQINFNPNPNQNQYGYNHASPDPRTPYNPYPYPYQKRGDQYDFYGQKQNPYSQVQKPKKNKNKKVKKVLNKRECFVGQPIAVDPNAIQMVKKGKWPFPQNFQQHGPYN